MSGRARLVVGVVFSGTLISHAYHVWWRLVRHAGFPRDTFLFLPASRFSDFFDILRSAAKANPYVDSTSVYFPFAFLAVKPFLFFEPIRALYLLVSLFWISLAAFLVYGLRGLGLSKPRWCGYVAVLTFLTYPAIFAIDRGNLELLLVSWVAIWMLAEQARFEAVNTRLARIWELAGATALGAAIAMKGYPALYALVYLADRRFGAAVFAAIAAVVFTGVGLLAMDSPLGWQLEWLRANLVNYRIMYGTRHPGLGFSVGFIGFARLFLGKMLNLAPPGDTTLDVFSAGLSRYAAWFTIPPLAGIAAVVFAVGKRLPRWQLLAWPVIGFLLFSEISFVYKLLHLFFPLALFLAERKPVRDGKLYAWLFALLLIPKDYGYLIAHDQYVASISSVIDPVLLLTLLGLLARDAIDQHRFNPTRF